MKNKRKIQNIMTMLTDIVNHMGMKLVPLNKPGRYGFILHTKENEIVFESSNEDKPVKHLTSYLEECYPFEFMSAKNQLK